MLGSKYYPRPDYHSFQPWVRWLPYPILVWLSLRNMGKGHIWFQSQRLGVELGLQPFDPTLDFVTKPPESRGSDEKFDLDTPYDL